MGISFFGSDALKNLASGDYQDAIWALNDEDPLLRSLGQLANSSNAADGIAAGTYTTIEALRAFINYSNTVKHKGNTRGMLGQRLGITDGAGNFSPRLTFRAGHHTSTHKQKETLKTDLHGQEANFKSSRDTGWYDGVNIDAKKVTVETKTLKTTPAKNTATSDHAAHYVDVGIDGSVGAGMATSHEEKVTHQNTRVSAEEIIINAENADLKGTELKGKSTTHQCRKRFNH